MTIFIRPAIIEDAQQVAPLIYEAIGDIAHRLTGETENQHVIKQLEILFQQTNNRHSYLNTFVAVKETSNDILGIIVLYSGADGRKLDASLQKWLERKAAPMTIIDVEAHVDEFYVDTICVNKTSRGLGIGTMLLQYAEDIARKKGFHKLSLNVEIEKEHARRLYEQLGYVITEPWSIINEPFFHMVKVIH